MELITLDLDRVTYDDFPFDSRSGSDCTNMFLFTKNMHIFTEKIRYLVYTYSVDVL